MSTVAITREDSNSRVVAANFAEDTFDALFGRFRKEVLLKVTRNDLTSNNDILRSIYNKLVDVVTAYRTEYKNANVALGTNLIEFKMGMRIVFQNVTPPFKLEECSALFVYFDSNKDGRVGAEEFVSGIKGKLNLYRSSMIDFVFQLLDKDCNGLIDEKDMVAYLNKTGTPGILQGKMLTPRKKSQELIRKIGNKEKEGGITLNDLQEFYIDRGLFIVDDIMFKYDVLDDWLLSDELATIYLRSVAPDFAAAGAVVRNDSLDRGAVALQRRVSIRCNTMDTATAHSHGQFHPSAPPNPRPTTAATLSPRQAVALAAAVAAVDPSSSNKVAPSGASVLEQQKMQLLQQMEMMRKLQESMIQKSTAPANSSGKSDNQQSSNSRAPGRNVSTDQLKELVETVRLLTTQLQAQNGILQQKEIQLSEMVKTIQDQSDMINSQQSMITTQQSIITTMQQQTQS